MTSQSTISSIAPAGRLPLFRGGRPLKRWRYVGVFGPTLMGCAASVQVGPGRQTFWALLDRDTGELRERTRLIPRRGELQIAPGRVSIHDRGVRVELELEEQAGIQARCPHGRGEVWTRKQAGVRAHGTISRDGEGSMALETLAVIDETAGYHARATEWWWAAGVGTGPNGQALAFNLVEGVNDPPNGSERAVWVDGEPHEVAPVSFARDLLEIRGEDGSLLRFTPEAERSRSENLLLLKSEYRSPFGTFSGTLPGGIALEHGLGVLEHHRARW